jgi:hypothetical protein
VINAGFLTLNVWNGTFLTSPPADPTQPRAAFPSAPRAMITCWIWLVPS